MSSYGPYSYTDFHGKYIYRLDQHKHSSYYWESYDIYSATIIDFTPYGPHVIFPQYIDGYVVDCITLHDKVWDKVTSLTFPEIQTIGLDNNSFPSLEKVRFIDNSFYTDGRMVYSSDKKKLYFSLAGREDEVIHVPAYVTLVDNTAFKNSRCKEIVFDNPKVKIDPMTFLGSTYIEHHPVFIMGDKLVYLGKDIPLLDLPDEVTKIDPCAFKFHSPDTLRASFLPELSEENSDNKIKAFELTSKEAPLSVRVLAKDYPSLQTIKVPEDHIRYEVKEGVLFDKLQKKLLFYPPCKEGNKYQMEEGTLAVGPYAFKSARYLEEVQIPDSVTGIGSYAFNSCAKLRKINLPAGIEGLPKSPAFGNSYGVIHSCKQLETFTLPEGSRYLGDSALRSSSACLKDFCFPDTMEYLGDNCLPKIAGDEIRLPASLLVACDGSLAGAKKVWAYEGTAKGLALALNRSLDHDWNRAEIVVLHQTGQEKALFLIPSTTLKEAKTAVAMAWDSNPIDYDAYDLAFRQLEKRQAKDKILMALLLVIDGGRRGTAFHYLQEKDNLSKAGLFLMEQDWKMYFDRYLALEGLSLKDIQELLKESQNEERAFFRERLLEKEREMGGNHKS